MKHNNVTVDSLPALGTSVKGVWQNVAEVVGAGGTVKVKDENLILKSGAPAVRLLRSLAEMEETRQRKGIEKAKKAGRIKGKQTRFTTAQVAAIRHEFKTTNNKTALAQKHGISRSYLYKLVQVGECQPIHNSKANQ